MCHGTFIHMLKTRASQAQKAQLVAYHDNRIHDTTLCKNVLVHSLFAVAPGNAAAAAASRQLLILLLAVPICVIEVLRHVTAHAFGADTLNTTWTRM